MKLGRIQTLDWLNAYIDRLENKLRDMHDACPGCGSLTWNAMNAKKRICDDCSPEAIMEGFRSLAAVTDTVEGEPAVT